MNFSQICAVLITTTLVLIGDFLIRLHFHDKTINAAPAPAPSFSINSPPPSHPPSIACPKCPICSSPSSLTPVHTAKTIEQSMPGRPNENRPVSPKKISFKSNESPNSMYGPDLPVSVDVNDFFLRYIRNVFWHAYTYTPDSSKYRTMGMYRSSVFAFTRMLRWVLTGLAIDCTPNNRKCLHLRSIGRVAPQVGHTMVGWKRLENLEKLVTDIMFQNVTGDILESGSWRCGASIYMRLVTNLHSSWVYRSNPHLVRSDRTVFICDSFQGLPPPREVTVRNDAQFSENLGLNVPYGLARDTVDMFTQLHGVEFVKGFFVDSMPPLRERFLAENRKLALLRLDGDMYESTIDVLWRMYDFVAVGGFVVVDDWGWKGTGNTWGAKLAVVHFKVLHGTFQNEPMINIDNWGAYWRKTHDVPVLHLDKLVNGSVKLIHEMGNQKLKELNLKNNVDF